MARHLISHIPRVLLAAGLLAGVAAAQAAAGFTIQPSQESMVTPGMTQAQVQQALGQPERNVQYLNEPGPTFTYQVASLDPVVFDVDFGADGRVLTANERGALSGVDHGRRH